MDGHEAAVADGGRGVDEKGREVMTMDRPIRVLQIIGIACGGGVEAVIMNYYRHIDKSKVQFDFVVHYDSYRSFVDEAKSMGGKVYEVTPYTKNIFAFTYGIYKIIKEGHYDIVHSNMNSLSAFPLFAAWLAGAKVRILHNHTTDTKAEGLRTVLKRVLRPFAKMFANRYWACSKLAGEWMYGKQAVESGKVTIINNAIDLDKFAFNQEKRDELRQELGLEGKFVIGHVGRMVPQKNHMFLLEIFNEALKQNKDARLLLIGDGYLREKIVAKAQELKIDDKVIMLGSRDDVADLYNAMDVFVFPSLYEGLPVVGVEVQANGLPFLCSDKVTKEIVISDSIELLGLEIGANGWAEKILIYRSNLCRKEQDLSNSGFDIEMEAKKLVEMYMKI